MIGFGGQAGGGKSDLLIGIALTEHRKSIIFRREFPLLKDLIERSRDIVGDKGRYNANEKVWRLDDGRRLEFGAVQYEHNVSNYRGRAHDLKCFDEATEFSERQVRFLLGWTRTTVENQRCRAVLTFNPPSNSEGRWVIRFFAPWIDKKHPRPAQSGELRWFAMVAGEEVERETGEPFTSDGEDIKPTSRTFFSAKLADNPKLMATGYGRTLMALPEPLRSQLLYGDFDADSGDNPWQLIPTRWIDAAFKRWEGRTPTVKMTVMGMDVAHGGKDQTVLAPRYGDYFGKLRKYPGRLTPDGASAAAYAMELYDPGAIINVDAIGYGASAQERLADMTWQPPKVEKQGPQAMALPGAKQPQDEPPRAVRADAINVGAGSSYRDRSGKYKMQNLRAEMYWRLREALDPENNATLALPPDNELLADLTSHTYKITPQGIKIDSKDEIKTKQGGRSPDCSDAVALAMLEPMTYAFL